MKDNHSQLDPAIRSFVDNVIVPALVREWLERQKKIAESSQNVVECPRLMPGGER